MMKWSGILSGVLATGTLAAQNPVGTAVATAGKQLSEMPVSGITPLWWIAPICALIALAAAFVCYRMMIAAPKGNARMEEIAGYVREGAMAYLKQQYSRVGIVFVILFVIFLVLAIFKVQNPFVPVAFLTGGFFSGLCGFLGMKTATAASSRTARVHAIMNWRGVRAASCSSVDESSTSKRIRISVLHFLVEEVLHFA